MFLVYRMKLGRIYDYKFIFGVIGVNLAFTGIVNFVYTNFWIRGLLILIYIGTFFLVLFKYRKMIFTFLKRRKASE